MSSVQQNLPNSQADGASAATRVVARLAGMALKTGQPSMIDDDDLRELALTVDEVDELVTAMGCELGGPFFGSATDGLYYLIEEALILPEWPYGALVSMPAEHVAAAARDFSTWLDAAGTGFRIDEHPALGAVLVLTKDFSLVVAFIDEHGGLILTADEKRRLFNENCDSLPQDIVSQSQRRTACAISTATSAQSTPCESSSQRSTTAART